MTYTQVEKDNFMNAINAKISALRDESWQETVNWIIDKLDLAVSCSDFTEDDERQLRYYLRHIKTLLEAEPELRKTKSLLDKVIIGLM